VPVASKQTAGGEGNEVAGVNTKRPQLHSAVLSQITKKEISAMFKQVALLLGAAALAVGVAACGGSSNSTSKAATSSAAAGTGTSASTSSAATSSAGTSSAAAGGASSNLAIAANSSGQLSYDKKTLSAKAGKVTITMTNMSPLGHNITVQQGTSGSVVGATPTFQGGTKSVALTLKPGKYTFFCSVPGHRAGGMVGTLTVS
jgi:plastocyanin